MFEEKGPIREQIKRTREEQILAAAGQVFAETGYHSAKMKDVAAAAGVSNGTVYNYFKSKEELLQALLHRLNETEQRAAMFHAESTDELPPFRKMFEGLFAHRLGFVGDHAEIFRAVLPQLIGQSHLRESYQQDVLQPSFAMARQWLASLMEEGDIAQHPPALTARILASQALGLLVLRLLGDQATIEHWEEFPALLTAIVCDGLQREVED